MPPIGAHELAHRIARNRASVARGELAWPVEGNEKHALSQPDAVDWLAQRVVKARLIMYEDQRTVPTGIESEIATTSGTASPNA